MKIIQYKSFLYRTNQTRTGQQKKKEQTHLLINFQLEWVYNEGELVDELKIWEHKKKDKGHNLKEKNTRTSMVATFKKIEHTGSRAKISELYPPAADLSPETIQKIIVQNKTFPYRGGGAKLIRNFNVTLWLVAVENRPSPEHADKYQINPGREVVMH